jgi:general secretion pathway protein D
MKTSGVVFHWFTAPALALFVRAAAAVDAPQAPELASIPQKPALPVDALQQPGNAQPADTSLRLNFRGAPLRQVLDYLSDAAGFIIDQQAEVRGTIDVWSKDSVTKDEAVELLGSVLRHNGYAVVRNGRILTIVPLENIKTADLDVVTGSNPDAVEKSDEVVTQIIPVHFAAASQLVNNLQPLLPATADLSVNESANSLILVATKRDIRRVLKIVSALDTSIATVTSIKVLPLHYADAKQLAPVLQQLFAPQSSSQNNNNFQRGLLGMGGPGGFGPPGFGGDQQGGQGNSGNTAGRSGAAAKVVVTADESSNALIINSPPETLASISNIVQELDQPTTEITELRLFKLTNADASELADQLSQLFPDASKASEQNQNQAGFRFGPFGGGPGGPPGANPNSQSDTGDRAKKKSQVLAAADRRSNSVLVSAPTTLMPTIAQMVEQLDASSARRELVQVYDLHGADPSDVRQILQDLFNRNNTQRTTTAANNSLTGQNNPLNARETQSENTGNTSSGFGTGANSTGQRSGLTTATSGF